jgi:CDP-4-dehydro-6-deoxyglucose reductase
MSYQVTIQPSGHKFEVAAGETILDAAINASFNLPYGCRNGTCGACKGRVLEGSVEHEAHQSSTLIQAEKDTGLALFCCAIPQSDVVIECREVSTNNGIRPRIMPARVQKIERLADDVIALSLKLPSNERLQFLTGQYIEFLLKDGQRRAFSLANAPHDDELLELHLRHVPGGQFTDHVFTQMQEKAILRLEGPFGSFYLREDSEKPIIFVAGGTGFAPIKGMIEHLLHVGSKRKVLLYWGARALKDLYLPALPQTWQDANKNLSFIPVLSEPLSTDAWQGRTGFVHQAVLDDIGDLSSYQVYCCGAPIMVDTARANFQASGLPAEEFFADAFTYAHPPAN